MKRVLLLLAIIVSGSTVVQGQLLKIIKPGTTVDLEGTIVEVVGQSSDYVVELPLWVVNTSGGDLTEVTIYREEIFAEPGTKHTTCWFICPPEDYIENQWDGLLEDPNSGVLKVGILDADTNKTFSSKHYPENISACALYRYTFRERGNLTDSAYVDIRFVHGSSNCFLSNEELDANVETLNFSVFPNPSNGTVNLDLQVPSSKNYVLNVVNVVGQNVISNQKITNGVSKLDWSHLNPGMYFVMLFDGDKAIKTKKIQIVR